MTPDALSLPSGSLPAPAITANQVGEALLAMRAAFGASQQLAEAARRASSLGTLPRIGELMLEAERAAQVGQQFSGLASLASALSGTAVAYDSSLQQSLAALRTPLLPPATLDALREAQGGLKSLSATLAAQAASASESIRAVQGALSTIVPSESLLALQAVRESIARAAVSPHPAAGASVPEPDATDGLKQQQAAEAAVTVAMENVVAIAKQQQPDTVTVEWVIQCAYLTLIAAGVVGPAVLGSFLSAIAAALMIHLLQSRTAAADTDRVVAASDRVADAVDRLGTRMSGASGKGGSAPRES